MIKTKAILPLSSLIESYIPITPAKYAQLFNSYLFLDKQGSTWATFNTVCRYFSIVTAMSLCLQCNFLCLSIDYMTYVQYHMAWESILWRYVLS